MDFCLSDQQVLTHLIECKLSNNQPHRAPVRFAAQFPQAQAVQWVRDLRQPEAWRGVRVERAGEWLRQLQARMRWPVRARAREVDDPTVAPLTAAPA